ncbi:MAG: leucine-rich repeat domain-containing protein [Bacteroidaceae bacterium]|nr:leucine-rich repeat domain-containing protein [Bacteroidaceae bacterium]
MGTLDGTVSEDGSEIYVAAYAATFQLRDENIVADEDYIYVYKDSLGGYEANCIDKEKASYGAIRTGINGKPTVALTTHMFSYNANLVIAPAIPDSVTSIGKYAFRGCTSLVSITIPDGVTSVGNGVFLECTGLTSITIPDSVTSIEDIAFYGCTSLDTVTFEGTVAQWNAITKGSQWNSGVLATQVVCTGDENGNGAGNVSLS